MEGALAGRSDPGQQTAWPLGLCFSHPAEGGKFDELPSQSLLNNRFHPSVNFCSDDLDIFTHTETECAKYLNVKKCT